MCLASSFAVHAQEQQPPQPPQSQPPPPEEKKPPLDFDLLEPAKPGLQIDPALLERRRTLLNLHQVVGLGMFGIALANTIVGQLNYSDRFASGPSTGKYELAHEVTAVATLTAFTATGLLAVFAPNPIPKSGGFDRITAHKIAMITAAAGMATEAALGLYTASREGYLNQPDFAAAHLVIGYVTFAAITVGVGTIVF